MHLWWCGVVCVEALIEESQGIEDKTKKGIVGWAAMGVQKAFNEGETSFQEAYINNVFVGVKGSRRDFCS
jgi:hypothetical protein